GHGSHRVFASGDGATDQLTLAAKLRRAVERGEFVLHYQPLVDMERMEIVGAEALIRWHDPERGLIAPARFVPLAERTRLIEPISLWVIEEACRQLGEWRSRGLDLSVSVNLPASMLTERAMRHASE